jgi:hypothetical protein
MESDDRIEPQSPIGTSHLFSTDSGMRAPRLQSRHARPHITDSRVAVSEDEGLTGKGRLR